jgi:hypothetical protein
VRVWWVGVWLKENVSARHAHNVIWIWIAFPTPPPSLAGLRDSTWEERRGEERRASNRPRPLPPRWYARLRSDPPPPAPSLLFPNQLWDRLWCGVVSIPSPSSSGSGFAMGWPGLVRLVEAAPDLFWFIYLFIYFCLNITSIYIQFHGRGLAILHTQI